MRSITKSLLVVTFCVVVAPRGVEAVEYQLQRAMLASVGDESHFGGTISRRLRTRCAISSRSFIEKTGGGGSRSKRARQRRECRGLTNTAATRFRKRTKTPTPTRTPTPTVIAASTTTPTPTPTPSPTPVVIPTAVSTPVVPSITEWEDNMIWYGAIHCADLELTSQLTDDQRLTATQYDSEWVFYQIAEYTQDPQWLTCAERAEKVYRDLYVLPNNGVVPGYWNFTQGVRRDYEHESDLVSKSAAVLISKNAAYAADYTPLSWTVDASMSREVAYSLRSYLDAEALGEPHRTRTESLVEQALGHLDQWFVLKTAAYVRPFMFALTAEALILYDDTIGDARILPALATGASWIWDNCWISDVQAFKYADRVTTSGGTEPAPDLNLLIAPVYAWLWHRTGEPVYRERADEIFAGGVKAAWLVGSKQFNENYCGSFNYVKWRKQPPLVTPLR